MVGLWGIRSTVPINPRRKEASPSDCFQLGSFVSGLTGTAMGEVKLSRRLSDILSSRNPAQAILDPICLNCHEAGFLPLASKRSPF